MVQLEVRQVTKEQVVMVVMVVQLVREVLEAQLVLLLLLVLEVHYMLEVFLGITLQPELFLDLGHLET